MNPCSNNRNILGHCNMFCGIRKGLMMVGTMTWTKLEIWHMQDRENERRLHNELDVEAMTRPEESE